MRAPKILLKVFNISLSLLIVGSLFLVDLSELLPRLHDIVPDLYAQSIGQDVKMYFDNAPTSIVTGNEFTLFVKLDSPRTGINAIEADISYPGNLLEVNSIDTSTSAFPLQVVNTAESGSLSVIRGSFSPVSGSGLTIVKINFKALLAGTANLKFEDSSAAVNSNIDSLTTSPGLTLNIKTPLPSAIVTATPTPLPSQNSTIKIYGAGTSALGIYPEFNLEIKQTGQEIWETVKTFSNIKGNPQKRTFQEFIYSQNNPILPANVRIRFTNDWYNLWLGDRNLMVDKISIDGVDIQTERSSTYSTGTWTSKNGCGDGTKSSEWLHCNGYFEYR